MADTGTAVGHTAPAARSLNVRVNSHVTLETLTSLISIIGGRGGCPRCGLVGVDIRLTGDPVEDTQLSKLPGVVSIG